MVSFVVKHEKITNLIFSHNSSQLKAVNNKYFIRLSAKRKKIEVTQKTSFDFFCRWRAAGFKYQ